jgi:hypothetical protein
MLTAILMVTLVVPDLGAAERAYAQWLGLQVTARGEISASLAASWDAPAVAGSRYLLLQSASGADVHLRLIERPPTLGYAAMRTHGWNSNEILVEDPAALERKFGAEDSPFRVIGSTAPLGSNPKVLAMQALGPAGELNYFTRIPPEGGTFIKTPARAFVDRTFIVVLGGPSMADMRGFYRDQLGQTVTEPYLSTVKVLQQALDLPTATQTPIALVPISPGFLIELDEYPPVTGPRPRRDGDLPPGMAMVSFVVSDLDTRPLPWRARPAVRAEAPYGGRRAGVLTGAAGEWIELIER